MSAQLQRLVLTFKPEELVMHTLYRCQDGPNPGTVRRRREVEELVRKGLGAALEALEGRVDVVGTSGFTTREDVVLCTTRGDVVLDVHKRAKRGA
jgi:hypothetical protein